MQFFFRFTTGRESNTWPANNCLQIMVCSSVIPSKCVIFCLCVIVSTLLCEKWHHCFLDLKGSSLNMKRTLKIEPKNNRWTRFSQNIVICQCLVDQLFLSAFGLAKNWFARHWQIRIFLNLVQYFSDIDNLFLRVCIRLKKHERKFERIRNAVGTRAVYKVRL